MSTNDQDQADDILNQLNSEATAESQTEDPTAPEFAESMASNDNHQETSQDTAEVPENQAKAAVAAELSLVQKIDRRLLDIQAQLAEKERLQLGFVFAGVPKPYYWRWKSEGNQLLSLAIGLRMRRSKLG